MFSNLEDGIRQRIAIIDETLLSTVNGLPHDDDLVLKASEIADPIFDIRSDTDANGTDTDAEDLEDDTESEILMNFVDPIPIIYDTPDNPWAAETYHVRSLIRQLV